MFEQMSGASSSRQYKQKFYIIIQPEVSGFWVHLKYYIPQSQYINYVIF